MRATGTARSRARAGVHRRDEAKGLDVGPGDFAENITTEGVDVMTLPVGSVLRVGDDVVLEVSQVGKVCHNKCAIYYQAGDCVMPREGVFAVVREAGDVVVGDESRSSRWATAPASARRRTRSPSPSLCARPTSAASSRRRAAQSWPSSRSGSSPAPTRAARPRTPPAARSRELIAEHGWTLRVPGRARTTGSASNPRSSRWPTAAPTSCSRAAAPVSARATSLPRPRSPSATARSPASPSTCAPSRSRSPAAPMLSRATAARAWRTLVVNLPGSEKAARECFGFVADQFEHAVKMMNGGGH